MAERVQENHANRPDTEPGWEVSFEKLLKGTQVRMYYDLRERLGIPPKSAGLAEWKYAPPTQEEVELGSFIEAIQPQFRAAVLMFKRKGYCTYSSGFSIGNLAEQHIVGHFPAHPKLLERLEELGIQWEPNDPADVLTMHPARADLTVIERTWRAAAAAFPDLHRQASMPDVIGHETFREMHQEGRLEHDFLPLWLADYASMYGQNDNLSAGLRFDGYDPHLTPEVQRKAVEESLRNMRAHW